MLDKRPKRVRNRERRQAKKKEKEKRKAWADSFYRSWQWKELRYEVLKFYGSTCMLCGACSLDGKRMVVDYTRPISKYPKLALDFHNCQVLCNDCNMGKGNKDESDWRPEKLPDGAHPHIRSIIESR